MIQYVETTTMILLWSLILSIGIAGLTTGFLVVVRPQNSIRIPVPLVLPGLIIGPIFILSSFHLLGINLFFPVHFFTDHVSLIQSALAPAFVLLIASGLGYKSCTDMLAEYHYWRQKPFVLVAQAYGLPSHRTLTRLVFWKGLSRAWLACLPWLFAELLIVEVIFNAPGLGLDVWRLARERNYSELISALAWLGGLYGASTALSSTIHSWIGRRLEGYC